MKMEYKAGERIFAEGDPSYYCYQIITGKVDIVLLPRGQREVIATVGPGEVFGEMGVIDSGPRSASAFAVEHTSCIVFSALDLMDQFEADPLKSIEVMKTLVHRLRQSNRRYSRIETEPLQMAERRPVPPRESYPVVGFDQPVLDAIEEWRQQQSPVPSMIQAIRRLVEIGLAAAAPPSEETPPGAERP